MMFTSYPEGVDFECWPVDCIQPGLKHNHIPHPTVKTRIVPIIDIYISKDFSAIPSPVINLPIGIPIYVVEWNLVEL